MAGHTGRQRHLVFAGALVAVLGIVFLTSIFGTGNNHFTHSTVALAGDVQTETRDVSDFDRIYLYGVFEAKVTAGEDYSLALEGDSALLALLETDVENGRLSIGWDKSVRSRAKDGVLVTVTLPGLKELVVDGAVDAELDNLDSPTLSLAINGAGEVTLTGTCGHLTATTNGAGEVNAQDFHCEDATLTINGAGEMEATASRKLTANINGVGDIDVYGSPEDVTISKSGFGSVTMHDTREEADD